jgi:tetratricopeptide (TPR) repeat protein
MGLERLVKTVVGVGSILLAAEGALGGDLWTETVHYRTNKGDSAVTYYCQEMPDGSVYKIDAKTREGHTVMPDGQMSGAKRGVVLNNGGSFYEKSLNGKGSVGTVVSTRQTPEDKKEPIAKEEENEENIQTDYTNPSMHVRVTGLSDGTYSGKTKDRKEAILDAKRQALEQAGIDIKSKTTVKNYRLEEDLIESEAKGNLRFDIVDMGYDGKIYKVELVGDVVKNESISKQDKEKATYHFRLGEEYFKNKDYATAKKHIEEAVKLDKNNSDFYNRLGDCYNELLDFNNAIVYFNVCLKLNPKDGNAYTSLGYAYYKIGKKEEAKKSWEKGVNLGDSGSKENLDWLIKNN